MLYINIIFVALIISALAPQALAQSLVGRSWIDMGSNATGKIFYDPASIRGESADRKISAKINLVGEAKDGVKSRMLEYSIDCAERAFISESTKTYTEIDLQGMERVIPRPSSKEKRAIQPNTLVNQLADLACNNVKGTASAAAPTNSIGPQPPARIGLSYFSRINTDKNLLEAFSVLSSEQRDEISWNFIVANAIFLTASRGEGVWRDYAPAFASFLPAMKSGVDRYFAAFDQFAAELGLPRAKILAAFNIKINEFGVADFINRGSMNPAGVVNTYIYYYGATSARQRSISERDLEQYYRQRPPSVLFTESVNQDIKKIAAIQQRVVAIAYQIESQLSARESERIKAEREAVIRREAEQKKIAEERQRREDFLKSPEGQRQLAAERKAREAAEELARPKSIDRRNLQREIEYTYYPNAQCTNKDNIVCLVDADYEHLCKISKGLTRFAASSLVMSYPEGLYLVENGSTDNAQVNWEGATSAKLKCRASIVVSGIVKGSSRRISSTGGVTKFIVNNANQVLAHSTTSTY